MIDCEPQLSIERFTPEEVYLQDVLASRPPLPVGQADISEVRKAAQALEGGEPGYAWERLPRWLAELKGVFQVTEGPAFVALDLCSSIPLYAQLLRADSFDRMHARASEMVGSLLASKPQDPDLKQAIHFIGRDPVARGLLQSAIQNILYTLCPEDLKENEGLTDRIKVKLRTQSQTYDQQSRSDANIEARWGFRYEATAHPLTYLDHLAEMPTLTTEARDARQRLRHNPSSLLDRELAKQTEPAGVELAEQVIKAQAQALSRLIGSQRQRFRPTRFLSMDMSEPRDIALSSVVATPASTQQLNMFSHAVRSLGNERQHLVGDIFQPLPLPDESLGLITCFDGWPFHFELDGYSEAELSYFADQAVTVLEGWYQKLAFGGKIVIFPWSVINSSPQATATLRQVVVTLADHLHHGVKVATYSRNTLLDWMSASDQVTAQELSPIFKGENSDFDVLIIEKPHASLARQIDQQCVGNRALTGAQIPDSPDPTP